MTGKGKTALIFGVSGQDGAYLARHLTDRGYRVVGTSRDREQANLGNLARVGLTDRVEVRSAAPKDFRNVLQVLSDVAPDEIYNLASQSSVGLSFEQPIETFEGITLGTLNILEGIRITGLGARFYNAASSEIFGNVGETPADELTPFRPRSPYGVAKAAAFWTVANYRESYGLFACSGILFNHESPLRPSRFVTRKIVRGALDIAEGKRTTLELGNLDITRDWGWAPDYVDAMARILAAETPEDYVIATGVGVTLKDFVAAAFARVGLDWEKYVIRQDSLLRPTDISHSVGQPAKAERILNWRASLRMPDLVDRLVDAEIAQRNGLDASGLE